MCWVLLTAFAKVLNEKDELREEFHGIKENKAKKKRPRGLEMPTASGLQIIRHIFEKVVERLINY